MGKKKFNLDYKKVSSKKINFFNFFVILICFLQGMEFLIENNLVENTPEAVAQFLFSGEGLNKSAIGNYLGEK